MTPEPDQRAAGTLLDRRGFLTRVGGTAALSAAGLAAIEATPSSRAAASPLGRVEAGAAAPEDSLTLLRRMLGFDTQNFGQGGKTRAHAEMLKALWEGAGVQSEIIPTPQPDNVHLIARIKGTTSAAPVLLLGHSDVVPVERENWSVDPFAGVVRDGQVYGRGALDM